MPIEKVETVQWRASDGQMFLKEADAQEHERFVALSSRLNHFLSKQESLSDDNIRIAKSIIVEFRDDIWSILDGARPDKPERPAVVKREAIEGLLTSYQHTRDDLGELRSEHASGRYDMLTDVLREFKRLLENKNNAV
jgi:dsDNA-binding SOS-regulon protein